MEKVDESKYDYSFDKDDKNGKIYHVTRYDKDGTYYLGQFLISFDQETILDIHKDYPYNFTEEQRKIFKKEMPFWAKTLEQN